MCESHFVVMEPPEESHSVLRHCHCLTLCCWGALEGRCSKSCPWLLHLTLGSLASSKEGRAMPWAHHTLISVQDPVLSKDPRLRCSLELDFPLGEAPI